MVQRLLEEVYLFLIAVCFEQVKIVLESVLSSKARRSWNKLMENELIDHHHLILHKVIQMLEHNVK